MQRQYPSYHVMGQGVARCLGPVAPVGAGPLAVARCRAPLGWMLNSSCYVTTFTDDAHNQGVVENGSRPWPRCNFGGPTASGIATVDQAPALQ